MSLRKIFAVGLGLMTVALAVMAGGSILVCSLVLYAFHLENPGLEAVLENGNQAKGVVVASEMDFDRVTNGVHPYEISFEWLEGTATRRGSMLTMDQSAKGLSAGDEISVRYVGDLVAVEGYAPMKPHGIVLAMLYFSMIFPTVLFLISLVAWLAVMKKKKGSAPATSGEDAAHKMSN